MTKQPLIIPERSMSDDLKGETHEHRPRIYAHVVTMSPEDTIQEATWKMHDQHVGSVIVAHGGKEIVGIVTDRDIALKLAEGESHPATPVSEIMSTNVRTIRANGTTADAVHYFKSYQIKSACPSSMRTGTSSELCHWTTF